MKHYFGINVGTHDSSVCHLTIDQSISVTVYEEERFTHQKHKGLFPYTGVSRMMDELAGVAISAENVGATNFMDSLEDGYIHTSKKLHFEEFLRAKKCEFLTPRNSALKNITHHEAHLFSVLPQVSEENALIVVADSCGSPMEWAEKNAIFPFPQSGQRLGHENVSVYRKNGDKIECILKIPTRHLINGTCDAEIASEVYCKTADFVFGSWIHCGKLMGLAAYHTGAVLSANDLLSVLDEGSYAPVKTKQEFDGLSRERFQHLSLLAASAQHFFEEWFMEIFQRLSSGENKKLPLYLTGGSVLNCLLNTRLYSERLFAKVHCVAFPNDEGVSIGAALAAAYKNGDYLLHKHRMTASPFLGSEKSLLVGESLKEQFASLQTRWLHSDYKNVAQALFDGSVVGWVFGRSECGPRALGHRSMLASAFRSGIKQRMNDQYKMRESFRPYGISILAEDVVKYFEVESDFTSPYMSFTPKVRKEYQELLKEVIQPDGSLRVQTVTEQESELCSLLKDFKTISGHGILLHTSLNLMGLPILETTHDVRNMILETEQTIFVINDLLIIKEKQSC